MGTWTIGSTTITRIEEQLGETAAFRGRGALAPRR